MNYLAHFHLAGNEPGLRIGALLGDHVKGPLKGEWPQDWERGIQLHRRIDALTDQHAISRDLTALLPDSDRRFAGIMLDICFDYCLAQRFGDWHHAVLSDYVQEVYRSFEPVETALPESATRQIRRLREHDILGNSRHWHFVAQVLSATDRRFKRATPLIDCPDRLEPLLPRIAEGFAQLYADIDAQLLDYRPAVLPGDRHVI